MKGILFKPDMIQAIIEGRKTNTRRVEAGLREINSEPDRWHLTNRKSVWALGCFIFEDGQTEVAIKPRYQVGETVYIKEAWGEVGWVEGGVIQHLLASKDGVTHQIIYPDENPNFEWRGDDGGVEYRKDGWPKSLWKSPLFMPEWAARYFIVIEQVRAERVQGITLEDCKDEGINGYTFARGCLSDNPPDPRWKFIDLWDSINPKYPWEINPFVFPYTFNLKEVQ